VANHCAGQRRKNASWPLVPRSSRKEEIAIEPAAMSLALYLHICRASTTTSLWRKQAWLARRRQARS